MSDLGNIIALAKDCTKPQYSPAMNKGPHEQALPKH